MAIRVDDTTKEYISLILSEKIERHKRPMNIGQALREFIEECRPDLREKIQEKEVRGQS